MHSKWYGFFADGRATKQYQKILYSREVDDVVGKHDFDLHIHYRFEVDLPECKYGKRKHCDWQILMIKVRLPTVLPKLIVSLSFV